MIVLCILFLAHWVADFVLQDNEIANNKWQGFKTSHLISHGGRYWFDTMSITIFAVAYKVITDDEFNPAFMWQGYLISLTILHIMTDFFTSKITHRLWKEEKVHNFFVVIGLDQLLHSLQIIILYNIFWI